MNGSVLDTDKRTDSKYLLTLHMVNNALNMNGVKTYFGFDARVYGKQNENFKSAFYHYGDHALLESVEPFPFH